MQIPSSLAPCELRVYLGGPDANTDQLPPPRPNFSSASSRKTSLFFLVCPNSSLHVPLYIFIVNPTPLGPPAGYTTPREGNYLCGTPTPGEGLHDYLI